MAFNRRLKYPFHPTQSTITLLKPNNYWERAIHFKSIALQAARLSIQHQQKISKSRFDKNRAHPNYNPGDLIGVKYPTSRSKLDTRFEGPFIIINRLSDVKYLIQHTELGYRQHDHINNFITFYDRQ